MSFRWEIIIIFFGSPIHWRSQHVPRGGTCHTWKTKLLGKKKSLTLNHIYICETCVLMGPFGKYMVFRTQLYEIWKPAFHVESYIFFMHSEPTTYFVPRLSPGLVIFQNYPFCSFFFPPVPAIRLSLIPSSVKSISTLLTLSPTAAHTSLRLAISLPLSFPSIFLSLSFSFDITKKEKEGRKRERGVGFRPVRAVSDDRWWSWQSVDRRRQQAVAVVENQGPREDGATEFHR